MSATRHVIHDLAEWALSPLATLLIAQGSYPCGLHELEALLRRYFIGPGFGPIPHAVDREAPRHRIVLRKKLAVERLTLDLVQERAALHAHAAVAELLLADMLFVEGTAYKRTEAGRRAMGLVNSHGFLTRLLRMNGWP